MKPATRAPRPDYRARFTRVSIALTKEEARMLAALMAVLNKGVPSPALRSEVIAGMIRAAHRNLEGPSV